MIYFEYMYKSDYEVLYFKFIKLLYVLYGIVGFGYVVLLAGIVCGCRFCGICRRIFRGLFGGFLVWVIGLGLGLILVISDSS